MSDSESGSESSVSVSDDYVDELDIEGSIYSEASEEEQESNDEYDDLENQDFKDEVEPFQYDEKKHYVVNIVPDDDRITQSGLTIYEMAEVIGARAQQIANGGRIFTDVTGLTDSRAMAEKEFFDGKNPLQVVRKLNHNTCEVWNVRDMTPSPEYVRGAFKQSPFDV
jgi:DNA-directed RNA polymerase subunit K/omega